MHITQLSQIPLRKSLHETTYHEDVERMKTDELCDFFSYLSSTFLLSQRDCLVFVIPHLIIIQWSIVQQNFLSLGTFELFLFVMRGQVTDPFGGYL